MCSRLFSVIKYIKIRGTESLVWVGILLRSFPTDREEAQLATLNEASPPSAFGMWGIPMSHVDRYPEGHYDDGNATSQSACWSIM